MPSSRGAHCRPLHPRLASFFSLKENPKLAEKSSRKTRLKNSTRTPSQDNVCRKHGIGQSMYYHWRQKPDPEKVDINCGCRELELDVDRLADLPCLAVASFGTVIPPEIPGGRAGLEPGD